LNEALAQLVLGQHAENSLLNNSFRPGRKDGSDLVCLETAGVTRVVMVNLLIQLLTGQLHFVRVDDDDMVAAIDVRGVARLVLAAQDIGDNRRDAADNQPVRIDQVPLLLDLSRLGRLGRLHQRLHGVCLFSKTGKRHPIGAAVGGANGRGGQIRQANPGIS
jgi:hypothetical protein